MCWNDGYERKRFEEKLKKNNLKFTDWLKENIEKYLKKN